MRTTIDNAGRLVIPKAIRDQLGVGDGGEVEVEFVDGAIEVTAPVAKVRLEKRDGVTVLVSEEDLPPLTDQQVRETLEHVRR